MQLLVTRTHQTDQTPPTYTARYQLLLTPDEQHQFELYWPPAFEALVGNRNDVYRLFGGDFEHTEIDVIAARQYEQTLLAACQAASDYIDSAMSHQGSDAFTIGGGWVVG